MKKNTLAEKNSPKYKVSFHLKLCRMRNGNWDGALPLIKLTLIVKFAYWIICLWPVYAVFYLKLRLHCLKNIKSKWNLKILSKSLTYYWRTRPYKFVGFGFQCFKFKTQWNFELRNYIADAVALICHFWTQIHSLWKDCLHIVKKWLTNTHIKKKKSIVIFYIDSVRIYLNKTIWFIVNRSDAYIFLSLWNSWNMKVCKVIHLRSF